jgi:hypothetical protein
MDTDLLNDPLCVTVLLTKAAKVHDTTTRESDGLVPLNPWSWTCLPVYSHRQRETVAIPTLYARPRENTPLETLPCRINAETRKIAAQIG